MAADLSYEMAATLRCLLRPNIHIFVDRVADSALFDVLHLEDFVGHCSVRLLAGLIPVVGGMVIALELSVALGSALLTLLGTRAYTSATQTS
jgi:hypothetical protein